MTNCGQYHQFEPLKCLPSIDKVTGQPGQAIPRLPPWRQRTLLSLRPVPLGHGFAAGRGNKCAEGREPVYGECTANWCKWSPQKSNSTALVNHTKKISQTLEIVFFKKSPDFNTTNLVTLKKRSTDWYWKIANNAELNKGTISQAIFHVQLQ